jgi:hypothetical protein
MALRAQWIVDPTDHSGRRMIAVWSRPAAPATVPADPPRLPINRAASADERADEEWPQAS